MCIEENIFKIVQDLCTLISVLNLLKKKDFTFGLHLIYTVTLIYSLLNHQQNTVQNCNERLVNKSCENMSTFKYLGMTVTIKIAFTKGKSTLNMGNACYHTVQNLISSISSLKSLKIKIDKTIILPAVLYGCETSSLTLGKNIN